jgi:hypothetical protein
MEVGQGQNWGCSAKKEKQMSTWVILWVSDLNSRNQFIELVVYMDIFCVRVVKRKETFQNFMQDFTFQDKY